MPYRLLPYERWSAGFVLERQRSHRTPTVLRTEQNYGRDGTALLAAALINGIPGQMLVVAGIVLLAASRAQGGVTEVAYWLLGAGATLGAAGIVRAVQAARAGRAFRDGRPFIRRY